MAKKINLRRLRRTDYVFAVIGLNVACIAATWFLSGGLSLMLNFGFRTNFAALLNADLGILAMVAGISDLIMIGLMMMRLQDAGYPGWWSLLIVPVALFLPVVAFAAIVGLLLVPGTIGSNRFGADPRGWKSKEHFDEQRARLKSGNI